MDSPAEGPEKPLNQALLSQLGLDDLTQDMAAENMPFLNPRSDVRGNDDERVTEPFHPAPVFSGHPQHSQAAFSGCPDSLDNIGRVSAGGDGDKQISGGARSLDLSGKDTVEIIVISFLNSV